MSEGFNKPDVSDYRMRYSQIATMMRLPLLSDPAGLDIAFAGVPFDGGTYIRPGARLGPSQIREMSRFLRNAHPATHVQPFELAQIADLGDAPVNSINVERSIDAIIEFFAGIARAGAVPLAMGGDHTIPYLVLEGLRRGGAIEKPIAMLQLDAHSDVFGAKDKAFDGQEINHGTFARLCFERGLVDPKRCVQLGLRGSQYSPDTNKLAVEAGARLIYQYEFDEMGLAVCLAEVRRVLGDGPCYITIDIDALDPAYCPGTGYPEPGGFTMREIQGLMRGLRGLDLIGADVSEVAPPFDQSGVTALNAAHLLFELLCLAAENVARKKGRV